MKILVPVDGSAYSKRMLAYLGAHDEWLGEAHEYTVIHTMAPLPPRAAKSLGRDALKSYYDDQAERVLKPIRVFFARHKALRVRFVAKTGHAADAIAELADRDGYDLVIMGSHGHGSLASLVMGSVATRVLARCRVPVLLVR